MTPHNLPLAVFPHPDIREAKFSTERLAIFVLSERQADVAFQIWIQAPQVADAFSVLGVLTDGDIDHAVIDHWSRDDVVASSSATQNPFGSLGVTVKFPQQFGFTFAVALRNKAVEPAVSTSEQDLRLAVENSERW